MTSHGALGNSEFTPEKMVVERQTSKRSAFPIGSKGNFSVGELLKLREGILEKNPPHTSPPFPARSSLHRSLDPCAWSWRQNRREGGGATLVKVASAHREPSIGSIFSRFPVGRFQFLFTNWGKNSLVSLNHQTSSVSWGKKMVVISPDIH